MNNYLMELNKVMGYILAKPKEEKQQILNYIDKQYDDTMSLSRKALRFYRENKPETFKEIMEGK